VDWPTFWADAVKILGPATLAAFVTHLSGKRQFEMAKWKLQQGDRVAANKRLFVFAQQLQGRVFPLAENKEAEFVELVEEQYFPALQVDAVHVSEEAAKILVDCEDIYYCSTKPELIQETEDSRKRLFDELFDKAQKLAENARTGANQ